MLWGGGREELYAEEVDERVKAIAARVRERERERNGVGFSVLSRGYRESIVAVQFDICRCRWALVLKACRPARLGRRFITLGGSLFQVSTMPGGNDRKRLFRDLTGRSTASCQR